MRSGGDTIVAIATAAGRGGIGVVRVSGPTVPLIARALLGALPIPRRATLRNFRDPAGELIDQGLAVYFPEPHSYTGEEVLELHGHGGPVVLDQIVMLVQQLGARPARPGEFTERAFLNDRMDLAQAEAVADLIDSASAEAGRAAARSLQGALSRLANGLAGDLADLRTHVEAAIDFPEEEIDFLADGEIGRALARIGHRLEMVRGQAHQGQVLRDGLVVVIAGPPNVGKSSLLNRLSGRDSAIVTALPGTTRDVLRERVTLDGLPLELLDTAGLRESANQVEREGVRRARAEIGLADRVLLLVDDQSGASDEDKLTREQFPAGRVTLVRNKIDLSGRPAGCLQGPDGPELAISALTGAGLDALAAHLRACAGLRPVEGGLFSARRRHISALDQAAGHLHQAAERLAEGAGELLAEELRLAQEAVGEITGRVTSEDLLGRIFSSFCIGK
jgi:tRNA modification GTPase